MDNWDDPFEPKKDPRRIGFVRCMRCEQVFSDDLLYLDPATGEWCCKNWPDCEGCGSQIVIEDDRKEFDDTVWRNLLEFDPAGLYCPPDVPVPVRCVTCLRFYRSDEILNVKGNWVCKYWPACTAYGYGLNIRDPNDRVFAKVGAFGVYRQKRCPPPGR